MSPNGKRADASRNRARLVETAREVLAESGNEAAFDVIARRAGVGNATLYRHFPNRADLLVAVYADEVEALCRRGGELLTSAEPLEALFSWLDDFVVHIATKRPLALAAPEERRSGLFRQWHEAINAAAAGLVERARPALRPGVATADILALASGAALATDVSHARRLVALLRDGVNAGGGSATPG